MSRILVILTIVALVFAGFYFGSVPDDWLSSYLSPVEEDPLPVLKLQRQDYSILVKGDGELTGLQMTPMSAPRVRTGALKIAWLVDEGKIVEPGELLVAFDQSDALMALEKSQNAFSAQDHLIEKSNTQAIGQQQSLAQDLEAAQLELGYTTNQIRKDEDIFSRWEIQESIMSAALARYRKLTSEEKGTIQADLSQADLRMLKVDQTKAQTEMKLAEETLSSLELKAPVGGVVLHQRFWFFTPSIGSEVWPGIPLVEIADVNSFRGKIDVVENHIRGVKKGKKVQVRLEAFPREIFEGTIEKVDKIAKQRDKEDPRKYFSCEVSLDVAPETLGRLKPGMKVTALIEVGHQPDALVLPKSAVVKKEDTFIVFLRENKGYVEKEINILDSDHGFYVVAGLSEGAEVCLRHPYEDESLHLPDFSVPSAATQRRRFAFF